jgi:uncharacterized protein (TIGR02996 family)
MTHDDFLAAIRADPADDLPRLQYADWLQEEGGDPARGEFIRCQCALASSQQLAGLLGLHQRASELFGRHWREWLGLESPQLRAITHKDGCDGTNLFVGTRKLMVSGVVEANVSSTGLDDGPPFLFTFHRGFLVAATLTWECFQRYVPGLVRQHPLGHASLVLTEPIWHDNSNAFSWWFFGATGSTYDLPSALAPHLRDTPGSRWVPGGGRVFPASTPEESRSLALAALSTALLRWAAAAVEAEYLPHPYVVPVLPTGTLEPSSPRSRAH